MAMTVRLMKNSKVDGITHFGNFSNLANQKSYFDGLSGKTYTVNTVKLGESLRINDKINNLIQYGYGYVDYGDGFRYYFVVADLEMVTETITDIRYTMDCFTTAQYQTDMELARAKITRYPSKIAKPVNPYNYEYLTSTWSQKYKVLSVMFLAQDPNANFKVFYYDQDIIEIFTMGFLYEWASEILASNIYSVAMLPFKFTEQFLTNNGFIKHTTEGSNPSILYIKLGPNVHLSLESIDDLTSTPTLMNDGMEWDEIRDMRGNVVFTCPYGRSLTFGWGRVEVSATQITARYRFYYDSDSNEHEDVIVPFEVPIVPINSWLEYNYRQREIDVESRNMAINQQALSGLVNLGSSTTSGAVAGGVGGIGAGAGAVAGAVSGLISSVGNYAINSYYSPKEQALTDKAHINSNGSLGNYGTVGDFILYYYSGGLYHVSWDDKTKDAYNNDVLYNGYYVDYVTDDFDSMLTNGPITADVEVLGDIPVAWKEQIRNRFAGGVWIG